MIISPSLDRQIEEKRTKIHTNPNFYLIRSQRVKADLRNMCNLYSFWLENPNLRENILRLACVTNPRKLRKLARKGVTQIKDAWNYLNSVGVKGNFVQELSPSVVQNTARLVNPIKNQGYRYVRVSLNLKYTPPNSVRVPEKVEELCHFINHAKELSTVELAALTHLRLTGIQPFPDGNKRTSRLIQDRILGDYGLPPALIPAGERAVYIDLLEQGLIGHRDGNIKLQRPFFDYIGGKVNTALDEILDDLKVR